MAPLTPSDPHRLGRYWLAGRLGAGGQGVVYEAYGPAGERVAVKVPRFDDAQSRARLAKEAAAAERVASFCTAKVLEARVGVAEPYAEPYIVSEFVPGPNLRQVITEGGPYEGDTLRRLAIGVATALTAIHQAGIVHRDLKPDNIILGPDGPRVIDFGVAREVGPTTTGPVMGTPNYMAPEVFTGRGATGAADLWAWALVVLFAARGADAIEAGEPMAVATSVLGFRPDTAGLPEPLGALVASALAGDPAERPAARDVLLGLIGDGGDPLSRGGELAGPLTGTAEPDLGAIAEELYGELSEEERASVPEVLLRMIDGDASIRPVTRAELPETEAVDAMLEFFASAGLVTRTGEAYELAKPGLIQAWPRLRSWVADNRDGLPVHRRLADAAELWDSNGRKPGDLLHGSPLDRTLQWAASERRDLTLARREREFLDAASQQSRRQSRRRGLLAAALAVLLVAALGGIGLAEYRREVVDSQRDTALARSLALRAGTLRDVDPRLARLLSVAGRHLDPEAPEPRGALYESLSNPLSDAFTPPDATDGTLYALDADGRVLASVLAGRVRVWDVRAHARLAEFTGVGEGVTKAALSPGGRTLAVQDAQGVRLWDVSAGTPIGGVFGVPAGESGELAFDRAGRTLSVPEGSASVEHWWDVATRRRLLAGSGASLDAVTPDRRLGVVSSGGRGQDELWDLRSGERLPVPGLPDKADTLNVRFSDDGRAMAITENLPTPGQTRMRVFSVPFGSVLGGDFSMEAGASVEFGFGGRYVAAWTWMKKLTVWRRQGWQIVLQRDFHAPVSDLHFDQADHALRYLSDEGTVYTVDVSALFDPPVTPGAPDGVAVLSRQGRALGLVTPGQVRLWDVTTTHPPGLDAPAHARPLGPPVPAGRKATFTVSPDGTRLAVGDETGVRVVDPVSGRTLSRVAAPTAARNVDELAFSPDGRTLAVAPSGSDGVSEPVELWNLAMGAVTRTDVRRGAGLAFRPDGRLLLAGAPPQAVNPATGARLPVASEAGRLSGAYAFSPDGRLVAVSGPDSITLWDGALRAQVAAFPPVTGSDVEALVWSPDGRTIATYEVGDRVRLWDVQARQPLGLVFDGQKEGPSLGHVALAFSGDSRVLYSATPDGVVREHPLDGDEITGAVCRRAARTLTSEEWRQFLPEADPFEVCARSQGRTAP
ncbi:WD40 repeat domain-containing serine/threonine-protein kinase [Nonomuraea sp. NPDC005983]|uniref:serine/threonine-protein kinase n=1 Tax=Nonomuraea sp. NPDC005983 TaxID=3155595 RepID=UPI0033BA36A8